MATGGKAAAIVLETVIRGRLHLTVRMDMLMTIPFREFASPLIFEVLSLLDEAIRCAMR